MPDARFQPSSPERQRAHSQQPKGLRGAEPSPVLAKQGREHPPPPGLGRAQPRPGDKPPRTAAPARGGPPSRAPRVSAAVRWALAGLTSASLLEAAALMLDKDFLEVADTPPPPERKEWHRRTRECPQ